MLLLETLEHAAVHVLQELLDRELIELESADAIDAICGPLARMLAASAPGDVRGSNVAGYLCAHHQVAELYASDARVEEVLRAVWDEAPAVKGQAQRQQVVFGARDEALEQRLSLDSKDAALLLVYGDWLQEQGDPLGELIAHQSAAAATADARQRRLHQRAASACLRRYRGYFLGLLADYENVVKLDWQQGFIRAASITTERYLEVQGALLLRELLALPTARFLQDLWLGPIDHRGADQYREMLAVLLQQPRPTLRTLVCGLQSPSQAERFVWTDAGDLRGVTSALPQLRVLQLRIAKLQLDPLESASLRELAIDVTLSPLPVLAALARSTLPALERLELSIGSAGLQPGDFESFAELFEAPTLATLRELALPLRSTAEGGTSNRAVVTALAQSPLLARLERLDLSGGRLVNDDVQPILDQHRAFAHLKELDLRDNALGEAMVARLAALGEHVQV